MQCFIRSVAATCAAVLLAGAFAPAAHSQSGGSDVAIVNGDGTFRATGVVISNVEVLTTASAVDGAIANNLWVEAGSPLLHGGTPVPVSAYTIHPNYNVGPETFANDIAIVYLAQPLEFGGSIWPATLPSSDLNQFVGVTSAVEGWWTQGCSGILSNSLAVLNIEAISTAEAQAKFDNFPVPGVIIGDSQVCLFDTAEQETPGSGARGAGIYAPDGGNMVLIGLHSWGIESAPACMDASLPSVGTRTSYFRQWIIDNTGVGVGSSPFMNMGHPKAGTGGQTPMLIASVPQPGSTIATVNLLNAKPSSTYMLALGSSSVNVPFKGGVLVPGGSYFQTFWPLPIDSAGTATLSFSWPPSLGVNVYIQDWVKDPGATLGLSASNGLRITF